MFLCSEAGGEVNECAIFAGKRGLSPIILLFLLLPYYYIAAIGLEILRSLGIVEQPKPPVELLKPTVELPKPPAELPKPPVIEPEPLNE